MIAQRKTIPCPETDWDCTNPDCSLKICRLRQERVRASQREAEKEAQARAAIERLFFP